VRSSNFWHKGYAFGVLAAGPLYAIMRHDGSSTTRILDRIHGGLTTGREDPTLKPGNIELDIANAHQILESVEAWIRANVK
jgi:hypothetical protein